MNKGNHNVSASVRGWNVMEGVGTAGSERVQDTMRFSGNGKDEGER